jgi:hypothetical protein
MLGSFSQLQLRNEMWEGSRNVTVSTYGNDPQDPENPFLLLFDGNIVFVVDLECFYL